jgi:hypothetical protein
MIHIRRARDNPENVVDDVAVPVCHEVQGNLVTRNVSDRIFLKGLLFVHGDSIVFRNC